MLHLHALDFVHRDIALRNVLINLKTLHCKLTDFGMSRLTEDSSRITQSKSSVLPIAWSAPESINGYD
eukprot:UN05168